jgi:Integrase zinc binding domain
VIYTDHKNLSFANFTSNRVLCWISKYQMEDRELQSSLISNLDRYDSRMMHPSAIVFQAKSERIVIPVGLQHHIIKLYHDNLKHPGVTQTLQTIHQFMVWPKMQSSIENYVNECGTCQRFKRSTKKYGKIPTKIPVAVPWLEVYDDQIGTYSLSDHPNATKYFALSTIDPASSWVELFPLPNLSSATTCMVFYTQCRYPRPYKCILIKAVPSLLKNSKSSSFFLWYCTKLKYSSKPTG